MTDSDLPPPDRDVHGNSYTGKFRLRPTWRGCVLEELVERADGTAKWKRAQVPIRIIGDLDVFNGGRHG